MQATNEDGSPARPMRLRKVTRETDLLVGQAFSGPGGLFVICSREAGDWHISVSAKGRYPTWDELRDVAWALQPERTFKVIVPPHGQPYTNLHDHCLHLWEEKA